MNEPASEQTPRERLATPVQYLKRVGPDRAQLLARLGLRTAADLLFYFPRSYQQLHTVRPLAELEAGEHASLLGTVEEIELRSAGRGRSKLGVLLRTEEGDHFRARWFNQAYLKEKFSQGLLVRMSGQVKLNGGRWEIVHPRWEVVEADDPPPESRLMPIYPLTEGITQAVIERIIEQAVAQYASDLEEVFPAEFLEDHQILPILEAVTTIHQPADEPSLASARQRFIYQELFLLQLALAMRRARFEQECQAVALPVSAKIDARIRNRFPFEMTGDQREAVEQIAADLARQRPMNRLLQGDVGSGKTAVALYAILTAVAHGKQAALMAPTEVLARQHVRTLGAFLRESRVRVALLVGSLTAKERRETLEQIAAGEVDVVIGTHAIIGDNVSFPNLALVVIDEQHKFGVHQRATLRQAGIDPHYLVMTATPIPRTVAMTLYGDLDVSNLRHRPPGRQPVHTYHADDSRRERWWEFFCTKIRQGSQGFIIAPLIDDQQQGQAPGVEQLYQQLSQGELAEFRLGLVHGQMRPDEKDRQMQEFEQGTTQVLIATQVVEVGVDVPNATLMTIEQGERFGLAQLHQLRGRVCRGSQAGYCCVFADPKTEDSKRRLEAFVESSDGFELAEIDFELRGPGDLFGTRQHGLPPFRVADLQRDEATLCEARKDAQQLIDADLTLGQPEFAKIRKMMLTRYGEVLDLGDVG